ncbi:hypothetical protein TNCV_440921 [Trichonephila clavipes]|nr:hypothetical protein TNCV_440921 [Trichonephila clavipes]
MPGIFHSSKYCTRTPRCVKCAKITWRRIARSPLTRNQNAISVRESTLPTTSTALKILGIGSLKRRRERRTKKTVYVTPEPPKVNFWEQRAKTFAQRQQSTSTNQQKPAKPPTTSTHPSKQKNNPEINTDIFDELKNPAVQETFELKNWSNSSK